jgi:hypothetical protein
MKEVPSTKFRPLIHTKLVLLVFSFFIFSTLVQRGFSQVQKSIEFVDNVNQDTFVFDASDASDNPISHHEALKWENEEKEENVESLNYKFVGLFQVSKPHLSNKFLVSGSQFKALEIHSKLGGLPLYILFHNLKVYHTL